MRTFSIDRMQYVSHLAKDRPPMPALISEQTAIQRIKDDKQCPQSK